MSPPRFDRDPNEGSGSKNRTPYSFRIHRSEFLSLLRRRCRVFLRRPILDAAGVNDHRFEAEGAEALRQVATQLALVAAAAVGDDGAILGDLDELGDRALPLFGVDIH